MRGSDAPFLLPLGSFPANPQYRVTVTDPDDDGDNLCTVIVGLMQKDRRKKREQGLDMLTIGYCIYKVRPPSLLVGIILEGRQLQVLTRVLLPCSTVDRSHNMLTNPLYDLKPV